ncbi:hypothetical protein [Bifidobacterium pseudocatenulatum]|uniref:hypothetical protein n=1 Tax=Bifidobacterium pseudocatenulatum TaxID=28026 RepID=UPI000505658F|nr:hypothetical protein [Bifidobacterium pseudocatenulatum]KFI74459.1 hypothetical protein BPSE_1638 [Bifidobacterium pseudocatenulatum DSM 20438 = JCM 1200 = LMG 10505]MZN12348.1 hypothetical protein [Bifidobacterium pseudocatenulatum]
MKISAMNETVCNHLFRDTPWRVSVRLTKTDRRGNLGVFANDFKLQLAERIRRFGTGKQRFYHLYIGGGGGGIFVSVIFMNAKVIILRRTHKVREKEKG